MKKVILIFLFLPIKLFSQDITGVWTGTIYNDTTQKYIPYEIAITENKGKLTGFSHTIFTSSNKEETGLKSIKIKRKDDKILIEDDQLVYNNYTEPPPKGVHQFSALTLSQNDSAMILSGPFNTNRTKEYLSLTGTIYLKKKKDFLRSKIILKLKELNLQGSLSFLETNQSNNTAVAKSEILKTSATVSIEKEKLNDTAISKLLTSSEYKKEEKNITIAEKKPIPGQPYKEETIYTLVKIKNAIQDIPLQSKQFAFASSKKLSPSPKLKAKISLPDSLVVAIKKEQISQPKPKETVIISSPKISDAVVQNKTDKKEIAIQTQPIRIIPDQKDKEKTEEIKTNPSLKKTVEDPAATAFDLSKRKIETIRSVYFKSDSLVLSLYDNGEVDGDTVSIILNGKNIMPRQGLTTKAITKTIYMTPDLGDSVQLVMYAENLGSIPPNTGLLILQDGDDRYEIRFTGDLQNNSAIILRRKRN